MNPSTISGFKPLPLVDDGLTVRGDRLTLRNTILDPRLAGFDIVVDWSEMAPKGLSTGFHFGIRTYLVLPYAKRRQVGHDQNGNLILTPLLAAVNGIVAALAAGKMSHLMAAVEKRVPTALKDELVELLQLVGAPRVGRSVTGAVSPAVRPDIFTGDNLEAGEWFYLGPGEVGISKRQFEQLNNGNSDRPYAVKSGAVVDVERFPVTEDGVGVLVDIGDRIIEMCGYSADVDSHDKGYGLRLNPHPFRLANGDIVSFEDHLDGDMDGDGNQVTAPRTLQAALELGCRYNMLWGGAEPVAQDLDVATWMTGEVVDYTHAEKLETLRKKALQKDGVGSISNVGYYGDAVWLQRDYEGHTEIGYALREWCVNAKESLEACFDQKHGEEAHIREYLGVLLRMPGYDWNNVEDKIRAMGLDVDMLKKLTAFLNTTSIRDMAQGLNQAFGVMHGPDKESAAASLYYECPKGKSLAEHFNGRLFPQIHGKE